MDIETRIRRRRDDGSRLIRDYEALSPVAHVDDPSGRGPAFERLLDHLDPVFDGRLPPNGYVHGDFGAGKSAVVTALFAHLTRLSADAGAVIHTSTRVAAPSSPAFAYVDLREAASEFAVHRAVLDAVTEDPIPEHGVSTADLRARLHDRFGGSDPGAVVAVDHVDDPDALGADALVDLFAGLPSGVSWLAVGRGPPASTPLTDYTARSIRIDPYRRRMLLDVLMARSSAGLARQGLDHDLARRLADWADGNAHDALAALFVAADRAEREGRTRLTEADVDVAIEGMPRPSVSLARVLTLPANKQRVLRALVDLDSADRDSVTATADAIAARPGVDLSRGTVERFLYELAETGVLDRVKAPRSGKGRPPSRVELRFPSAVFRRLYDLRG